MNTFSLCKICKLEKIWVYFLSRDRDLPREHFDNLKGSSFDL